MPGFVNRGAPLTVASPQRFERRTVRTLRPCSSTLYCITTHEIVAPAPMTKVIGVLIVTDSAPCVALVFFARLSSLALWAFPVVYVRAIRSVDVPASLLCAGENEDPLIVI